jgi:hypothetical protein
MTPQEKAKKLFDKYCFAIRTEETDSGYFTNVIYAKDCALIAVDEILNDKEEIDGMRIINDPYWIKVKQEIENL